MKKAGHLLRHPAWVGLGAGLSKLPGGFAGSQFQNAWRHTDDLHLTAGREARLFQPAADQADFRPEPSLPVITVFFNLQPANRSGVGWHKISRTPVTASGPWFG